MPFPANKNVIRDVDGNIGVPDPTKPQHAANKAYVDAHAGGGGGGAGAKWLSGTGVPAAGLGTQGDWYFDIATDRVYEKTGPTVWTFRSDLTGSPGATGPTGATGAAGPAGAPGAPGANGAGVPAGGATGTLLTKNSAADNDTKWAPAPVSLPPQTGHATQFLTTDGTAATWDNTAVIDSTDSGVLVVASQGSAAPAGSVAMPAGSVIAYAGLTAPAGWLLCDGSAVSRTTYAGLFAAISTTYGVGDGSTTFNLPHSANMLPERSVRPQTVGAGGTIGSDGVVTFSGAGPGMAVNKVFDVASGMADGYRVQAYIQCPAEGTKLYFQLISAGSALATGYYSHVQYYRGTSWGATTQFLSNYAGTSDFVVGFREYSNIDITIKDVGVAGMSTEVQGLIGSDGSDQVSGRLWGRTNTTAVFDGFRIVGISGTSFTGWIKVSKTADLTTGPGAVRSIVKT